MFSSRIATHARAWGIHNGHHLFVGPLRTLLFRAFRAECAIPGGVVMFKKLCISHDAIGSSLYTCYNLRVRDPIVKTGERTTELMTTTYTPGTLVDHYEIIRMLGHGGMNRVYLARDITNQQEVVLKFPN